MANKKPSKTPKPVNIDKDCAGSIWDPEGCPPGDSSHWKNQGTLVKAKKSHGQGAGEKHKGQYALSAHHPAKKHILSNAHTHADAKVKTGHHLRNDH